MEQLEVRELLSSSPILLNSPIGDPILDPFPDLFPDPLGAVRHTSASSAGGDSGNINRPNEASSAGSGGGTGGGDRGAGADGGGGGSGGNAGQALGAIDFVPPETAGQGSAISASRSNESTRTTKGTITNEGVNSVESSSNGANQPKAPASDSDTNENETEHSVPSASIFGNTQLGFEVNQGQTDPQVRFLSRGAGFGFWLTDDALVFSVPSRSNSEAQQEMPANNRAPQAGPGNDVFRLRMVGANPNAQLVGIDELSAKSNYFIGSDPAQWHTNVPQYARIEYRDVFPGVDLAVHSHTPEDRIFEYDFIVKPGASAEALRLRWEGVEDIRVDDLGRMHLTTAGREVIQDAPVAYQDLGAVRHEVPVRPVIRQEGEMTFELAGGFEPTLPVVIDPTLAFSTYLGGSGHDYSRGIAVDTAGNAYVTGLTWSPDFPTSDGYVELSEPMTFVTKLNETGDEIVYSSFLPANDPFIELDAVIPPDRIAVDLSGNVYLTGVADASAGFPITDGAFQSTASGNYVPYLAKIGEAGDVLLYSTYLAGTAGGTEPGNITVDALGNAYVVGIAGAGFPVTTGAFQTSYSGYDGYFAKMNPEGSDLVYGSYLAGTLPTEVAVDEQGNAYITGFTTSSAFPVTSSALQSSLNGTSDAFVAKVNQTGTALTYATYLGGSGSDEGRGIVVDCNGLAWVAGFTSSTDFATTTGAYQTSFPTGAVKVAFVSGLNATGTALDVSTYLGGTNGGHESSGFDLTLDSHGRPTVFGRTNTSDFPTLNALQSSYGGGLNDTFLTRLTTTGTLSYSTYYGGSGGDWSISSAADPRGQVFVAGWTESTDLPGTSEGVQTTNPGNESLFVAKFGRPKAPKITSISSDTGAFSTDRITTDQTVTVSGIAQANLTVTLERADVGVLGSVQANGSGNWSYDYSATTLAEGTYDFIARAVNAEGEKSDYSAPEFLVTVDRTGPNVSVTMPSSTPSLGPEIRVVARDLIGVSATATVTLDVDLNYDSDFTDQDETGYATGNLTDGQVTVKLPTLSSAGTYRIRARVDDLAGNEGTSTTSTFVVSSVTSAWTATAMVLSADPVNGDWQNQLGDVSVQHALDLDRSPDSTPSSSTDDGTDSTKGGSTDSTQTGSTGSPQSGSGDSSDKSTDSSRSSQSGSPALVYHSSSVALHPIVQVTLPSVNNASLPSTITAELTFDGVTQASPVTFSTTGFAPGDVFTFALQADQAITTTGRYGYSVLVQVPGETDQTITGSTFVVAADGSALGAGWGIAGVDKLVSIASDATGPAGMLRVYGQGGYRFYEGTSTITSPTGDNGTLSVSGGTYTYATPNGQTWTFDSNGRQTAWTSADGKETLAYSYDGSSRLAGLTAIDGGLTTFTYNSGNVVIQTVNNRTTTLTLSSGNLASITNPDSGLRTFTYDSSHKLTREQFGNLENNWEYTGSGVVGTYTRGAVSVDEIANQDRTTYKPAVTRGMVTPVSGTVFASKTDPTGHKDAWEFDATGKVLRHVAPDGGLTKKTYSNGYVATETDPLDRTTTYTRDTAGFITQLTQPDSSLVTLQYQSAFHALTTIVNQLGAVMTLAYDSAGHITSLTDPLGNRTTYNYNATTGLLNTRVDPRGGVTTYQYDSSRRLTATVDPLGNITTYAYDANGNQLTVTDALGRVTTTTHDAMGRPISKTDALGNITTTTYDASGQKLTTLDPMGKLTSTVYDTFKRGLVTNNKDAVGSGQDVGDLQSFDAAGRVVRSRDAAGWSNLIKYDANGRVIEEADPLGDTKKNVWDAAGQKVAERDQMGRWTNYTYNLRGKQTEVKDNLGNVTTTTYDAAGNVTTKVDALGNTTSFVYDSANKKTVEINPLGNRTTTSYNAAGKVSTVTDPLGHVTSYAYDALDRKTQETNAVGTSVARTRSTSYDAVGNVRTTTDGLGNVTTYTYDALNRRTEVLDPLGNRVTTTYDAAGKAVTTKDSLGKVTTYTYDALHRQVAQTDPLGNATTQVLDANGQQAASLDSKGNLSAAAIDPAGRPAGSLDNSRGFQYNQYDGAGGVRLVVDMEGNEWHYVPDAVGREKLRFDPLGAITTTTYDAAGQSTARTDRNGRAIEHTYNEAGKISSSVWKDATGATGNTLTYTYDNAGNRLTSADSVGTVTYTFDELNRVKTYTNVFGQTLTYSYDAEDHATRRDDSLGGVQTSTYNAVGLLTSRQFGGTGQTQVRVDFGYTNRYEQNSITRYSDLAGTTMLGTSVYSYDDAGHLTSIVNKDNSSATLSYYTYSYDSADRITGQTWSSEVGTFTYSGSLAYDYDCCGGQLHSDGTTTYAYDLNGNRAMTGYETGAANRVTNDGVFTYSYDGEGNLTQKSKGSGQETWYFGYDNANHLTTIRKTSDGTTNTLLVTYTFDSEGKRVKEQTWGGSGPAETRFAYDLFHIWADLDSTNAVTVRRMFGDKTDQLLTRIVASGPNAGLWFYQTDAQGNIRDLVDANSDIKAHLDYDGYGVRTDPQSSVSDRYGYTGREFQVDSGIQHNRRRDYIPALGKWMQEDPISFSAGDFNVMRYVKNDPVNRSDPSGLLCGLDLLQAYYDGVELAADMFLAGGGLDGVIVGFWIGFTASLVESAVFGGACFTGDMEVLTRRGWVRWDTLTIQDEVASRDEFDWDGPVGFKRVEEIFNTIAAICHVHVGGRVIRTTGQHPFWVSGKGWVEACTLQPGDMLLSHDGTWVVVEEVFDTGTTEVVYNCRVSDYHTYFVGGEEWGFSIWAHNTCTPAQREASDIARQAQRERRELAHLQARHDARRRTGNPGGELTARMHELIQQKKDKIADLFAYMEFLLGL